MKLNYVNKIKANISIYSNKKTSNILEGTYKSVYKGKSMNFENLRKYVVNDDVKDIDWKSSARTGELLVKQFIAEKKHNIMLIMDTGIKMDADTDTHERKKDVALYTAGTLGYLAIKNNDYVGMTFQTPTGIEFKNFKYNLYNLEEYLCDYEKYATSTNADINKLLEFVFKNISKKMIVFIITDINGLESINISNIKKLNHNNNVLVVNINDNYMLGDNVYDLDDKDYIPNFFLKDPEINKIEHEVKDEIISNNKKRLKKNNVTVTSISSLKEINYKVIELLEEHKYASNH